MVRASGRMHASDMLHDTICESLHLLRSQTAMHQMHRLRRARTCAIEAEPSGFSSSIHSNTSPSSGTPSSCAMRPAARAGGSGGTASCSLRSHAHVASGTKSLRAPMNWPACRLAWIRGAAHITEAGGKMCALRQRWQ